jgi:Flp pilus assembly protein TadD
MLDEPQLPIAGKESDAAAEAQPPSLERAAALLKEAQSQLQGLAERPSAPANYAFELMEFLIRQIHRSAPAGPAEEGWARLRGELVVEAQSRLGDVRRSLGASPAAGNLLRLAGCRVRLAKASGDLGDGRQAMSEIVDGDLEAVQKELGEARTYLALGSLYAALDEHAEAEAWYRKLVKIAPQSYVLLVGELAAQQKLDAAIDACLQATPAGEKPSPATVAVMAQLISSNPDSSAAGRVEPILADALAAHPDNVDLLLAVAVLNVTKAKNEEATRMFQRVIEVSPNHTLALNNLATLLAEQPNEQAKALEAVNRAISIGGRQPALLDTLGTVQLRTGEYQQAVETLEEATAGVVNDSRYYFHLAVAYHKANRMDDARRALDRAHQRGLEAAILTPGDRALLNDLTSSIGSGAAEKAEPVSHRKPSSGPAPQRPAQMAA